MRTENAADLQATEAAPPAARLSELVALYEPLSSAHFRPYALIRDDVDAAFEGGDGEDFAEHRARRMKLVCAPLEQLMSLGDDISGRGSMNRVSPLRADGMRAETCKLALHPAEDRRDIRAMASFQRLSAVRDGQLELIYLLKTVTVLPAYRDTGMDRLMVAAVAAQLVRELDQLVDALWHSQTLTVQVRFSSQVAQPQPRVLDRIIAARLCDELIAQDSLLRLDGKLARFQPLIVEC